MKNKKTLFLWAFVLFGICPLFFLLLLLEASTSLIALILCGVVVHTLVLTFFVNWCVKRTKCTHDRIAKEMTKNDADILYQEFLEHSHRFSSDVGMGYLYEDSLVYAPYASNKNRETPTPVVITFSEIRRVSWNQYQTNDLKTVKIGLKVTLKSGRSETFLMNREGLIYKKLSSWR